MITLHIEARSYAELVGKVADMLGGTVTTAPEVTVQNQPLPIPVPVADEAVTYEERAALQPAKRGRPRSNKQTPAPEAAPQGDSSGSQPAVEGNTGSEVAAPQSPAAEPAPASGGVSGDAVSAPPASTTLDLAAVRAKLSDVNEKFGEQGLAKVSALIKEFGYDYVKKIQPEHFAAIVAKADALLAA